MKRQVPDCVCFDSKILMHWDPHDVQEFYVFTRRSATECPG